MLHSVRQTAGARLWRSRALSSSALRLAAQKLNQPLKEADPELVEILELEKQRQRNSLVLIASENFTSRAVYDALGVSEGEWVGRVWGGGFRARDPGVRQHGIKS
jgi:glycine hydroxymethyltransferase